MDAAYDPAAWHDFGVALVSATAALLGLVFVVVSLHLKAVVNDSVLRRRAEITLGLFATALVASAVLLIPGQSRQALGIELMPIALVYIGFSTLTTVAATRSQRGVSRDRLARFFFGELSAGLIFLGGLGLVIHALGGAYPWRRASSSACCARCSRSGASSSAWGSSSKAKGQPNTSMCRLCSKSLPQDDAAYETRLACLREGEVDHTSQPPGRDRDTGSPPGCERIPRVMALRGRRCLVLVR
jgi:hypothetical protein